MIETTLHYYKFNTKIEEEREAYIQLCTKLKGMGLTLFDSISANHYDFYSNKVKPLDGKIIHLETKFLFDNQWNCEEGLRVFDWSEAIYWDNRSFKQGMWLEQTQEMKDIRDLTKKCGYCGAMSTGPEEFCTKCLGSEYLEEDNLRLLRMYRVSSKGHNFPLLTEEELAWLRPQWEVAQGLGKEDRELKAMSKARKKVAGFVAEAKEKASKLIAEAEIKTEAYTWLLDNKFRDLDNVIYYTHTKKFCFGWYKSYGDDAKWLHNSLKDFPFDYEVK